MATELEIKLIGALKAAWNELAETCEHCVYNKEVQCLEKQCPDYTEGVGVVDANDPSKVYPDFPWSCLDFDYGDCPHMDNTPCHGCIDNNTCNFRLDVSTLDNPKN